MKKPQIQYNKTKWHSVANPSYGGTVELPKGVGGEGGQGEEHSGKRGALPPAVLHKIAMNSSTGGRARCECCHDYFAMYYMRMVKFSAFKSDWACQKCRGERNLQVIK